MIVIRTIRIQHKGLGMVLGVRIALGSGKDGTLISVNDIFRFKDAAPVSAQIDSSAASTVLTASTAPTAAAATDTFAVPMSVMVSVSKPCTFSVPILGMLPAPMDGASCVPSKDSEIPVLDVVAGAVLAAGKKPNRLELEVVGVGAAGGKDPNRPALDEGTVGAAATAGKVPNRLDVGGTCPVLRVGRFANRLGVGVEDGVA